MAKLIADNFLFFLSSNYDKDDKNSLVSFISEFYLPEELVSAKKTLINECEKLGISDSITKLKTSRQLSKGDGIQKVIRDIVDIWSVIDIQKGGRTISTFVVDDPKRLPSLDNNSQNFRQLFALFKHLQKQVADIGNIVTRIDKKSELPDLSCAFASNTSLNFPSSPRSLPWTPAPEIETQSASLKRKLNSSAVVFLPSKHRKGDDSTPIVLTTSEEPLSATTTTTTPTTTTAAASGTNTAASSSISTLSGATSIPVSSIVEAESSPVSPLHISASASVSPQFEQLSPLLKTPSVS